MRRTHVPAIEFPSSGEIVAATVDPTSTPRNGMPVRPYVYGASKGSATYARTRRAMLNYYRDLAGLPPVKG